MIDVYEMLKGSKVNADWFVMPLGYSSEDYLEFFRLYRKLVLDSELPISCITGYSLTTKETVYTSFAQLTGTTMSYLEMVKALRTFRFFSAGDKSGKLFTRKMTTPFNYICCTERNPVSTLNTWSYWQPPWRPKRCWIRRTILNTRRAWF